MNEAINKCSGICLECSYSEEITKENWEWDEEYDEFSGKTHPYPICPKCGGAVEVSIYDNT